MSIDENNIRIIKESYDAVNYDSKPFPQTHPGHLQSVANVFGHTSPDFTTARILELGCSSGGNIIPIAFYFPNTRILGIDLSEEQIKLGREMIDAIKLENITLRAMDVSNVTKEEFGLFDYIIVHGVYSWVPESVQNHILRVCSELLVDNGVSYISYNTLPGWNIPKSFREMMLYHIRNIDDCDKKIERGLAIIQLISQVNESTLNNQILREELKNASECSRYYFLHEYLERYNEPCYFHEFMKKATEYGLQYLSETNLVSVCPPALLPSNILNNFPKNNDIIDENQYLDFFINRKFRMTLLCKQSIKLSRNVSFKNIAGVHIKNNLSCSIAIAELTLDNIDTAEIKSSTSTFKIKTKLFQQLAYYLLKQAHRLISITELIVKVCSSFGSTNSETILQVQNYLQELLGHGGIEIIPPELALKESASLTMPKLNALAKYQIEQQKAITLVNHASIHLNTDIHKILAPLVDGTRSNDQLLEKFIEIIEEKNLPVNKAGVLVTDIDERNTILNDCVKEFIQLLSANNLLETVPVPPSPPMSTPVPVENKAVEPSN